MSAVDLFAIRREHGGVVFDSGRRWSGPGPGHSKHDRSLSLVVTDGGRALVHSFAGDSFRDCAAYLGLPDARPLNASERARELAKRKAEIARAGAEARALCSRIWDSAVPICGTPAEMYLRRRGLEYAGGALRYHREAPRSRRPDGPPPHQAMIGAVQAPDGRANGLHCTYITTDGRKAFGDRSRLMFGKTSSGAVRLLPLDSISLMAPYNPALAVGEGIETSLAFAALKCVPTWAALSTSGLRTFVPPSGIKRLLIAADNDDNGAGMEAAQALAVRVSHLCDVEIHPSPEGQDWADAAERGHG